MLKDPVLGRVLSPRMPEEWELAMVDCNQGSFLNPRLTIRSMFIFARLWSCVSFDAVWKQGLTVGAEVPMPQFRVHSSLITGRNGIDSCGRASRLDYGANSGYPTL